MFRKKKKINKKYKNLQIKYKKIVILMKQKSPPTHQSHSPSPRSAKQISETLATWDLGPLSQRHCIGHVTHEDLSIAE